MQAEFIFQQAPVPACHASTIAETADGLIAAWFGGSREGHDDVGIWVARRDAAGWRHPVEVADGRVSLRRHYPCWNPVLFRPRGGPLLLFYKLGPRPSRWWGMVMASDDDGRSWSESRRLPERILGPIKNKPVELADGTLLAPSSDEEDRWRVHLEWSRDGGESWERGPALNDGRTFAAIQPTLLTHPDGRLQLLCRTRQGAIGECWSADGGRSWSAMEATELPNPDSGIDAVTLADGRFLLIYNHSQTVRTPLNLALSTDGRQWSAVGVLEHEPGEFSYPAIIQGRDGTVHATYTWNRRRIRHIALSPTQFAPRPIEHGVWPE